MKSKIRVFALILLVAFAFSAIEGFALTGISSDIDGDGSVTTLDARRILMIALGTETAPVGKAFFLADSDGNYQITTTDARNALLTSLSDNTTTMTLAERYDGEYSAVNGTYGGTDDLNRTLMTDVETTSAMSQKTVGIFYFLWQGEHGTGGPYDNSVIAQRTGALLSESGWLAAGGGSVGEHHFWGKPLLDYYVSSDRWVLSRHCQMLTDAGVDYIIIDTTNAFTYQERFMDLATVWLKYQRQGWDVPKIAFYTNSSSGSTMTNLYNTVYRTAAYSPLWFYWDGKPLIIGNTAEATSAVSNYFTVKSAQWPNESRKANGWPWMEFTRVLTANSVYGVNGRKEVINVSVAQHNRTVRFSQTAWYGGNDRSRSWHNGANDYSPNAVLYGYNFAEQFEFALLQDTETIFITGWNEWVAQRQPVISGQPIVFVDCADPNTSRDIEPMSGLFGDNYYMQMINFIRRYKGTADRVDVGAYQTIDVNGDFAQWESPSITANYTDYEGDTSSRSSMSFGNRILSDSTGRNDIVSAKVARDYENIYFYVKTKNNITPYTDENRLTLFIDNGSNAAAWEGFSYAVNIGTQPSENTAYLYKCNSDGHWVWSVVCTISVKVEGNQMMLAIPRSSLGIDENRGNSAIDIQFKWTDNLQTDDAGNYTAFSFYLGGDSAPYGRMTYIYSEKK